ncbi:hypothetical protein ASE92_17180 [Pedobacter sp. Leaf41]|nr:hypothetical protein ASE92_17180 [Pedobacter sp. Leaf41]
MKRSYNIIEKRSLLIRLGKVKPFHYLVIFYATVILVGVPIRMLKIDALTVIYSTISLIVVIIGCAFFAGIRKLPRSQHD